MRAAFLWLSIALVISARAAPARPPQEDLPQFRVLVFTRTTGFRHDSIPAGIEAIRSLGKSNGFAVDATEDPAHFNDLNLAAYRVIVFLNPTGEILDLDQQAAFERFIRNGGGFVGIHSATDTEYDWPWYGQLAGARLAAHPAIQAATLRVADANHPSTHTLPLEWVRTDEWYDFVEDPSRNANVLLSVDESTYSGGRMGERHPISWYHDYDGGRAWYTAMGHTSESYREPFFLNHLLGGILWLPRYERAPIVLALAPHQQVSKFVGELFLKRPCAASEEYACSKFDAGGCNGSALHRRQFRVCSPRR
jgi:type 1 glutamine amidotransferase